MIEINILRKAIRTWLKHLGKIDKIYNDIIKDAIKHILRANILKNGRDFLHKNGGKIVIISKKKEIKNLLPYRRRYELLILFPSIFLYISLIYYYFCSSNYLLFF